MNQAPLRALGAMSALLTGLAVADLPAAAEVYPTDRCVSEKLAAAGRACRQLLNAQAVAQRSRGAAPDATEHVAAALERTWSAAEARSAAAGVDCSLATVTSAEMTELLRAGAASLAGAACDAGALQVAAGACDGLLQAESRHLLRRSDDRERKALLAERARVLARAAGACDGSGSVAGAVEALARDATVAATVSPHVSRQWTMLRPADEVEYGGRTLAPICSRGTPYAFFARRGSLNKLLVYFQGGGACWDYGTCEAVRTFDQAVDLDAENPDNRDNPANFSVGLFDLSNSENLFRDWSIVMVPYCTGDIHWGEARFDHELVNPETGEVLASAVIEHKGFANAQVVEKWAREHFVNPDQVFVTGSSAGAYGAIVNSLFLQENVYPSSDFAVLGDAGNGVITQDFLEFEISKWGVEPNLPPWIPALNVPLTELNAAELWIASAETYPQNRFATYTTAYDGSLGGQTGFYNIMLHPFRESQFNPVFFWPTWWRASCLWNEGMRELNATAVARAPNYRFYVGSGSRHTMWGSDKVYADRTGGVSMTIVDWIRAMIDDAPEWVNVECSDCGLLLPGDPSPNVEQNPFAPPEQPFTADGRIVCEVGG